MSGCAGDDGEAENIQLPSLSVSASPQRRASKTRENRMHAIEDVSARVPLLCHRCALLFLSQPSGSEKVGTSDVASL